MGQVVYIQELSYLIYKAILVFNWIYLDNLQLKIFHKQKKKQECIQRKYLDKFYQEDARCLQDTRS